MMNKRWIVFFLALLTLIGFALPCASDVEDLAPQVKTAHTLSGSPLAFGESVSEERGWEHAAVLDSERLFSMTRGSSFAPSPAPLKNAEQKGNDLSRTLKEKAASDESKGEIAPYKIVGSVLLVALALGAPLSTEKIRSDARIRWGTLFLYSPKAF